MATVLLQILQQVLLIVAEWITRCWVQLTVVTDRNLEPCLVKSQVVLPSVSPACLLDFVACADVIIF
jgi:hypothetical protein